MEVSPLAKRNRFLRVQVFPLFHIVFFANAKIPLLHRVRHGTSGPVAPIHVRARPKRHPQMIGRTMNRRRRIKQTLVRQHGQPQLPIIGLQKSANASTATQPAHLANRPLGAAPFRLLKGCGFRFNRTQNLPACNLQTLFPKTFDFQLSTVDFFKLPPPPHTSLHPPSTLQSSLPLESHRALPPPCNSAPPPRTQSPVAAASPTPASAHK